MDQVEKHLEFIQGVITRLARNSFLIKGWAVTLLAALFALASKDPEVRYAWIAFIPTVMFWGLDAYYLRQERLFRELYDAVRERDSTDFTMDTSIVSEDVTSIFGVAFSKTIFPFYAILSSTIVLAIFLLS